MPRDSEDIDSGDPDAGDDDFDLYEIIGDSNIDRSVTTPAVAARRRLRSTTPSSPTLR
jgi:hypothetical protein